MKRFLTIAGAVALPVWIAINAIVAGLAVFSGYAGHIDQEFMPFAGIVGMTFPLWYGACVLVLVADLLLCRPASVLPAAAMLIAIRPLLVFAPLNFVSHKLTPEEGPRAFTLLSYNILSFVDEERPSDPETFNRTMHTVLSSGADMVVLLEFQNQGPLKKFMPRSQIDSLHAIYPYNAIGGLGTAFFSKRPILHITPPEHIHSKGSIEAFRTEAAGRNVNVFGVHLESIGLDDRDKALYRGLTQREDIDSLRSTASAVRSRLISKLLYAFVNRAKQARMVRSYVEQLGGDAIVCGDFNDVPGCRALTILEEAGMHDAYSETALGPCVTFNAPKFKFRIDHVLWRGDFRAVKIKRGNVPSSDHYPLLTTFVWNQRGTND